MGGRVRAPSFLASLLAWVRAPSFPAWRARDADARRQGATLECHAKKAPGDAAAVPRYEEDAASPAAMRAGRIPARGLAAGSNARRVSEDSSIPIIIMIMVMMMIMMI